MVKSSPKIKFSPQRSSSRKQVLAISAALIFSLIVFWPAFQDYFSVPTVSQPPQVAVNDQNQVYTTAKELYLDGTDKNKQPYTLTASDAHDYGEKGIVEITSPHLTIKLNTGDIVSINSDKGVFYKEQQKIELINNVTLTHSTGYKFSTALIWIHLNESKAFSETPVEGDGPQGRINAAKGFELLEKGKVIKFFGRPNLILSKGPQ